MRPYFISKKFGLKNPIYLPTASFGHFGREPYTEKIEVFYEDENTFVDNKKIYKFVEFFGWEKLDHVDKIKEAFQNL